MNYIVTRLRELAEWFRADRWVKSRLHAESLAVAMTEAGAEIETICARVAELEACVGAMDATLRMSTKTLDTSTDALEKFVADRDRWKAEAMVARDMLEKYGIKEESWFVGYKSARAANWEVSNDWGDGGGAIHHERRRQVNDTPREDTNPFIRVEDRMPPKDTTIEWIAPSGDGPIRGRWCGGAIWMLEGSDMYVYYRPVSWRPVN